MSAVMSLLLALLGFAIAGPALLVAFVAAHVWLATTIVLRLCAGAYVRAALWCCILAALVAIDVSCAPASARYDLPQDYLDALRDALPNAAAREIPGAVALLPATHCDLAMELQEQSLHVVRKCFGVDHDEGYLHVRGPRNNQKCTTHVNRIQQTDHVTYLVYYIDSGSGPDCENYSERALQFQLVADDTLQITNTENY
jgi:hypothetical protein